MAIARKRGRQRRRGSRALTGGQIKRAGTFAWEAGKGKVPRVGDTVSSGGTVRVVRAPGRSAAGFKMRSSESKIPGLKK